YSILLAANTKNTPNPGVFDYVILNNSLCSSYSAKDGNDVYSFSFDRVPVAEDEFGTNLKGYQDQIDALKGIGMGEIANKIDVINAVRENIYLKKDELQKFYSLLDFTPYDEAYALLLEAMNLSDAGKAVAEDFKKLSDILAYDIKGVATDGNEIAGYLYNEIEKFKTIKTAYSALEEIDQQRIFFHIEKDKFDKWDVLATDVTKAKAEAQAVSAKIKLGAKPTTAMKDWTEQTAEYALDELVFWSINVKYGRAWGSGENDDGNGKKVTLMNFDNNTYPSIRIILCREFLEANNVTIPTYVMEMLEAIQYDDFYEGGYYPVYGTVQAAMKIHNNEWLNNEELQDFLNDVWSPDYVLSGQIAWNWNTGSKFEDNYSARTKRIAEIAGGTLTYVDTADGGKVKDYKTYMYFEDVANFLKNTLGFEIKSNGWGITEGTINLGGEESEAALAVAAKINGLSTLNATYEVKNWAAYYGEVETYREALVELNALSTRERFAALGKVNAANWAAWGKESEALAAIMADEKFKDTKNVIKMPDYPMAPEYVDQTPEYAMKQLAYWASCIARGRKWTVEGNRPDNNVINEDGVKVCDLANNAYPSIRVAVAAHFLQDELGLTLTPYMQDVLTTIKCQEFYNDDYEIIAGMADLAKSITDSSKTKITDLSAEQLAFVQKYFTSGYNGELKSKFISANGQSSAAIGGIIKYVGAEIAGKEDLKGYFDVVSDYLVNIGYTKDTNWGVTEMTIFTTDIAKPELQVINIVNGISDLSGNKAVIKGWHTDSAAIAGYLGNELEAYRKFKVEYAKLTAEQQASVKEKANLTDAMLTAWDKFDTEMTALQANDALKNLNIKVSQNGTVKTYTGEDAMADLLGVLLAISRGENYGFADSGNGVKKMTSDEQWLTSFHACFLVEKFTEANVKLPSVIDSLLVQVEYKSASGAVTAFVKDFKYIYNVLNLAEKIKAGTASKNGVVAVVNNYMKGMTRFAEGGIHWNFTNGDDGLPNQELTYRHGNYKTYFGFANGKAEGNHLIDHIGTILNLLDGVEYTTYGETEYKFGVKADITVANVKGDMPEGEVIETPLPQSTTVLPATADGWNLDELENKVTVTVANGVHKIDATGHTEGTGADSLRYSASIAVNKKLSKADGKIVYDLATTSGYCDIVIYVAPRDGDINGGYGHYVYFSDFGLAKDNFTGKGYIT
ncbi:MAG: hypothetical protein K2J30_03890, partial [Clostridia bacterium]|nr:hypothetical protein [Clostridia bacterium]